MSLTDEITDWIRTRVSGAQRQGIVFGLSGGLDSAVVAALAKRALGNNILGLIMPCHSLPEDEEWARLVATRVDIPIERVDLAKPFDALVKTLGPGTRMAEANLKPRLRMATLYYFATDRDFLVAGTSNKSELLTGYFTKHGDGGADLLPIGGLLKTEVRSIARELGIPEEVISRPPTAGLWAGQTDEADLGMTYEDLDRTILAIEAGNTDSCQPEIVARVHDLLSRSTHKRSLPPIFEPIRVSHPAPPQQ